MCEDKKMCLVPFMVRTFIRWYQEINFQLINITIKCSFWNLKELKEI